MAAVYQQKNEPPHSHPAFYTFIQLSTPPSIMSARPSRKAVNSRPSTDILNGNVRRRTSEQVKKDQEAKKAASVAAEQSNVTARRLIQEQIARLEDDLRKEDIRMEMQSVRPDLQDRSSTTTLTKLPEPEVAEPVASAEPEPHEDADGLSYVGYFDSEMQQMVAHEGDFLFLFIVIF